MKGWRAHNCFHPRNDYHVWPEDDTIEHLVDSPGCPCGPRVEEITRVNGSTGVLVVHHALDGRELAEREAS